MISKLIFRGRLHSFRGNESNLLYYKQKWIWLTFVFIKFRVFLYIQTSKRTFVWLSLNTVHILLLLCFTYLCLVSLFLGRQSSSGFKKKRKRQEMLVLNKTVFFVWLLTELYPNNKTLFILLVLFLSLKPLPFHCLKIAKWILNNQHTSSPAMLASGRFTGISKRNLVYQCPNSFLPSPLGLKGKGKLES